MNPLARIYAEKRFKELQAKELRGIAKELREQQEKIAPLRAEWEARRKERMRQDGPNGFVLVQK